MLKLLDKGYRPVTNNGVIFYWSKNGCVFAGDPIVGGALALGGQLIGAGASKRAASTGAAAQSQASQDQLQLMREQLSATQPLRDLALEQGQLSLANQQQLLPLLQQAISQPLQLGQGVSQIQSSLAPFGLEDSSVSGTAVGQFAESARQNRLQNILSGLGLGGIPGGFGTAGLGTAAQLGQGAAQSQLGAGQFTAAGQLGAGQAFSQPLLQLGGFGLQGGFDDLFKGTGQQIPQLTVPSQSGFMAPPQGGGGFQLGGKDFSKSLRFGQ